MIYDPDKIKEQLDAVDAEEFGIRVARQIAETMHSNEWGIVARAFKHIDPFGLSWEDTQELIERIANRQIAR
jgi:hypothetical protein